MRIDDPLERFFYEFECIKGVWSVRELKRQIASKLYFRAGISKKPELLLEHIQNNDPSTALSIKDPYTFEFLELNDKLALCMAADRRHKHKNRPKAGNGRPFFFCSFFIFSKITAKLGHITYEGR